MSPHPRSPLGLPARLGWVAFLNDCSSEALARTLPLVLTGTLGMPPTFLGWVEGLADSLAILLKLPSGWWSDRARSRKGFVLAGYGLAVTARALYLTISSPMLMGLSRVLDRIGKGLRGAPRDAMVADAAATGFSGRAFGLTRFLDTLGAMAGLSLVLLLLPPGAAPSLSTFRTLAWLSLPLGLGSLFTLLLWIPALPRLPLRPRSLGASLPPRARSYLGLVFLFGLANSSDAFLVLRAREAGYSLRGILTLFLVFNGLAAALSLPAGRLSDRFGRVHFLAAGWAVYAVTYAAMGLSTTPLAFGAALFGYGAFHGLTEGVEKALLADLLPPESRGTGFGAFHTVTGVAAILASPLLGAAMARFGSCRAFLLASGLAGIATLGLLLWVSRRRAI